MPTIVAVMMPVSDLDALIERYHRGDESLLKLLRDCAVIAISLDYERALNVWEDEGGTCS